MMKRYVPFANRIQKLEEEQKKAEQENDPIRAAELGLRIIELKKGLD